MEYHSKKEYHNVMCEYPSEKKVRVESIEKNETK